MENLIILIGCIIALAILCIIFDFNMKKIKKVAEDKKLDEIANKFPKNEEICKAILKKLNNEKVKIKQNEDKENKSSLYIAVSDTIFIANIKDTYTRIQTIAHECLHSVQNRKMLLFNFYYSNIYLLYFLISTILTILKIFTNYKLQIIILLLMSFIYYVVRSYLETDAMTKAKYVAEDYMKEYIKNNNEINEIEVEELCNKYDEINKIGIPVTNYILFANCIIKIIIYCFVAFILSL
jgi:hypothetical protein